MRGSTLILTLDIGRVNRFTRVLNDSVTRYATATGFRVYLNVAETGIGTYGVEAGAQRYFGKSAASLSPIEAARMAAALPLPKERSVKSPRGWLARHGNTIAARIGAIRRGGLDSCI